MPDFTPTQGRYLSFIHAYTEAFGQAPSMQEIADALKVQSPSVNGMLKTLDKKGLIERSPGVARSIEILLDPVKIPAWKKRLSCSFDFYGSADMSQAEMNRQMEDIIYHRKRNRRHQQQRRAVKDVLLVDTVYHFKITLKDSKPAIWRRFETTDTTLELFHETIQTVMGWTNSHLHEFTVGKERLSHPMFFKDEFEDFGAKDYSNVTISQLVNDYGAKLKMIYLYDFGDGWEHDVVLEKTLTVDPDQDYPRCVNGKMACPPEDVGGIWGFAEFVDAISNPQHDRHQDMLDWNGPYDPTSFDAAEMTKLLHRHIRTLIE